MDPDPVFQSGPITKWFLQGWIKDQDSDPSQSGPVAYAYKLILQSITYLFLREAAKKFIH